MDERWASWEGETVVYTQGLGQKPDDVGTRTSPKTSVLKGPPFLLPLPEDIGCAHRQ